jgi:hypothetical protein
MNTSKNISHIDLVELQAKKSTNVVVIQDWSKFEQKYFNEKSSNDKFEHIKLERVFSDSSDCNLCHTNKLKDGQRFVCIIINSDLTNGRNKFILIKTIDSRDSSELILLNYHEFVLISGKNHSSKYIALSNSVNSDLVKSLCNIH